MTNKVLLVDDDVMVREALGQTLDLNGMRVQPCASYIEAKDHISRDLNGVVVSDIRMPGKDGFALLEWVQSVDPELPVIMLTGEGDIPMAVRGINAGAFDFLEKPCDPTLLLAVVSRALRARSLVLENRALKAQAEKGDAAARLLFGESSLSDELRSHTRAAARVNAHALVYGEPGTGTSKVAEVVHLLSGDASRPFVKLPAAGLTRTDLNNAFERAAGGTLFLDEIAALEPQVQFDLLDLLDRPLQTRMIAGTYRILKDEVEKGEFNPDLYYKMQTIRIRIPALRERRQDIPVLFRHYVSIASEQAALSPPDIDHEVIGQLMAQDWPGNARSLMNAAMRFAMGLGLDGADAGTDAEEPGLVAQLAQVERSLLIEALQRHAGSASAAARRLQLPRKTFYDKLARHGLRPESFKA